MMILPDRLALRLGKLGHTFMWAGSNEQQYWLFDLHDDKNKTLYVGRHDQIDNVNMDQFPLPVQTSDLPVLLGLVPLDVTLTDIAVTWDEGRYVVRLADPKVTLWIDPRSFLLVQAEIRDEQDRLSVTSRLSRPARVQISNIAPGGWPTVQSRIELHLPDREGQTVLYLSRLEDGAKRIRPGVFDLDNLRTQFKPHQVITVDEQAAR